MTVLHYTQPRSQVGLADHRAVGEATRGTAAGDSRAGNDPGNRSARLVAGQPGTVTSTV